MATCNINKANYGSLVIAQQIIATNWTKEIAHVCILMEDPNEYPLSQDNEKAYKMMN